MITLVSVTLQKFFHIATQLLLKIDLFPPLLPFLKSCFHYIDFIPAALFEVTPSRFPILT